MAAGAQGARGEAVHVLQTRGDAPPDSRIVNFYQHRTGRELRPIEPRVPMRAREEMRPEQLPALQVALNAVIVKRARPQHDHVAGMSQLFARLVSKTAAAADGEDQQKVVGAV